MVNENDTLGAFTVYTASSGDRGITINVKLDNEDISMQLDTGAAVSLVYEVLYQRNFPHLPIEETNIKLKAYSGENIPLLGYVLAPVEYADQKARLTLVIVKGDRPAQMGRNWLESFKLDWSSIFTVDNEANQRDPEFQAVLKQQLVDFSENAGTIEDN